MSGEETKGEENEGTVEPATEAQKAVKEEPLAKDKPVGEAEEVPGAPEPTAIGNEKIAILKHDIYIKGGDDTPEVVSIVLAIKNVSDTAIGSVLFEAELYDIEGNILGKVGKKTVDFKPNISRAIHINYSGPESDKVRSYCVRVAKIAMTPEPKVTGNEKIVVLKHSLNSGICEDYRGVMAGADIAIRNISDTTIASLLFEATFYDIEGNVLEIVQHKEIDLKPNTSRGFNIHYTKQEAYQLTSYDIKITRMTTTDLEKVYIRRHEMKTTDAGEEVMGIVKNISQVKTDTAIVATFFDSNKENIGTKIVILRDIEPDSIKQFRFIFKPVAGDRVSSYALNIGNIIE